MRGHSLVSVLAPCSSCLLALACTASVTTDDVAVSSESLDVLPTLSTRVETGAVHQYDEAPRSPDADDPAIWVNRRQPSQSFVLGTLNGGLQVYDLAGAVVQTVLPPNRPAVSPADPPVAGAQPDVGTSACPDSESGVTFGRFNNVDVVYDFPLRIGARVQKVDLAVLTDRGCDRVRSYVIDASQPEPLREVTAIDAPRVFPKRFESPSPFQSPGAPSGLVDNPLDDQSTAYGITLTRLEAWHGAVHAFVTQRSRSTIAELELKSTRDGRVSYETVRELRFDPVFRSPAAKGAKRAKPTAWTPCREDPKDDPQFEGVVVDAERGILYAAEELVGLWRIDLDSRLPKVVKVPQSALFEPTKSFGQAYWAVPDDDEFSCEPSAPLVVPTSTVIVAGNPAVAGRHLVADAEGLAIYSVGKKSGYLIASSQGDDTFHVFDRDRVHRHLGAFKLEGTGETDGHAIVEQALGDAFPFGLFVSQNGAAPPPASTAPINGHAYDGSTRFEYLGWEDIADELGLVIDAD